jgi:hypothetical protein
MICLSKYRRRSIILSIGCDYRELQCHHIAWAILACFEFNRTVISDSILGNRVKSIFLVEDKEGQTAIEHEVEAG